MTSQDHNKALIIIYSLLGSLFSILILASPFIIAHTVDDIPSQRRNEQILIATIAFCVVLCLALLLLSTAYGLHRRKQWARTVALVIAVLVVWSFPLGTAFSIYTWWFLHSEGAKQLFLKVERV